MCSGGPKCGGSSASRSEKIPFVSSEFALTVIEKTPRSIDLPSPDLSTYASPAPATMVASRGRWEHIVIHSGQADVVCAAAKRRPLRQIDDERLAEHLAGRSAGQLVEHFDAARVLVRREPLLDECGELF